MAIWIQKEIHLQNKSETIIWEIQRYYGKENFIYVETLNQCLLHTPILHMSTLDKKYFFGQILTYLKKFPPKFVKKSHQKDLEYGN